MVSSPLHALRQRTMHPTPSVRFDARRLYHEYRGAMDDGGTLDLAEPLTDQLRHRSAEVRWRASRRCFESADLALVQAAAERLKDEPDAWVRAELVRVTARLGAAAVETLVPLLSDPDERVRANAVEALTAIDDQPPLVKLESLSQEPHHRARAAALVALAKHGYAIWSNLWDMWTSDKPWLRTSAEYVVRTLRAAPAPAPTRKAPPPQPPAPPRPTPRLSFVRQPPVSRPPLPH